MRLYILGQEIELKDNGKLAQTKQVNDIGSVSTRQTNYTNAFTIPKTAKNIRTFDGLGLVGNGSNVPYQKNECYLYNESGECFIYKGWATITETTTDFKCNIYDGNLELYKAVENKTLADLDITALEHDKTLTNVVDSFADTLPYKYIIADYNGKCLYDINKINIDYLVPSVRASYLIQQIEAYSGFTLNGSFKTNPDFINLWLSYPNGLPSDNIIVEIYNQIDGLTPSEGLTQSGGTFTATEEITIVPVIYDAIEYVAEQPNFSYLIILTLNGTPIEAGVITLNTGDVLAVEILTFGEGYISGGFGGIGKINKYTSLNLDFIDVLTPVTITSFLNEILWMFCLTLFKNKYDNSYEVKTLPEILDTTNAIDWSSKFDGVDSEKYVFSTYAQKNYFRWQYNQDKAFYNDGTLDIRNQNLTDSKTVIQSKIFTPDLSKSDNLGFPARVYRLWDKDNKDDGTVTYKPKANHFYFLRSKTKTFASQLIGSDSLAVETTITSASVEDYTGLNWHDLVNKNYRSMRDIIDKAKVITATFYLKDADIIDIDFSKLIYIRQLGAYFMLNKINNFTPNTKTKCELVRITPNSQSQLSIGDFTKEDFNITDFYTT